MRRACAILAVAAVLGGPPVAVGDETAADYAIAARRLQDEGNLNGALLGYTQAIALAQTVPDYYCERGKLEMDLGRPAAAAVDFRIATLFDPDGECPDAWLLLGQVRTVLGRYREALAVLNEPVLAGDADAEVCYWRGFASQCLGEAAAAVTFYRRASDLEESRADARRGLAESLALLGRLTEAFAEFARVIELEPENPVGHCARGFARLQQALGVADREQVLRQAESDFRAALALDERAVDPYAGLALVELSRGRAPAALDRLTAGLTRVSDADKAALRWRLWLLFAAAGRGVEARALLVRLPEDEPPDSYAPVNVVAGRCALAAALRAKPEDVVWRTELELGLGVQALAAADAKTAGERLAFCRARPYGFAGTLAALLLPPAAVAGPRP